MPLATHHRAWPDRRAITAAAYARAEAAGIRFGFQMNVDSSMPAGEIAARSPAAAAASGPPTSRASHHVPATAAIPNSAISPVTTTGSARGRDRRGRQQVVVDGPVVERPDRGLRAEQRDLAVDRHAAQDEHVRSLVGVPPAAGVDARQAREGGQDQDPEQDEELEAPGARGRHRAAAGPSSSAGALRPFVLRVWKAAGGRAASGRPCARSLTRAMLTAS